MRRRLRSLRRFIFISYARRDEARVKPALAAVAARGHVFWADELELEAKNRSADIEAAIRAACGVIVFWSVDAFASRDVARQVATAARFGKPILPVFLDNVCVHRTIQASDPAWTETLVGALETFPRRSLPPPGKPIIRGAAPLAPINSPPHAQAVLIYDLNWFAGVFTIVFAALFTLWGAMVSGGPPSSMELALARSEVGAAYVTSLRNLESAVRSLRTDYCRDLLSAPRPLASAGWEEKAQAACLSGPNN